MKNKNRYIIAIAVIALAIFVFSVRTPQKTKASAPMGYVTKIATSSYEIFSQTQEIVMFATTTPCTSRIVTTNSRGLMIKMGDTQGFTLQPTVGIFQAASTTVTYDSGLYGCGKWTAISAGDTASSSSAIVEEFRDFN